MTDLQAVEVFLGPTPPAAAAAAAAAAAGNSLNGSHAGEWRHFQKHVFLVRVCSPLGTICLLPCSPCLKGGHPLQKCQSASPQQTGT